MAKKGNLKISKAKRPEAIRLLSSSERDSIAEQVTGLAEPLCVDEGLELVHVECVVDGYLNVLRVYIDKPGGVNMDDCAVVSRQLGDIVDVNVSVNSEYRLEVSSPGIFRRLYNRDDYERFKGNVVKIEMICPVDGRKKYKGLLDGISESGIVEISMDGESIKLDYSAIKKAHLTEDNGDDKC